MRKEEIAAVRRQYARAVGEGWDLETWREILLGGGGVLPTAMTLIQVAPPQGKSMVRRRQGHRPRHQWGGDRQGGPTGRDLKDMKADQEERDAISCRSRILHFGDETIHGVRHTKNTLTRSCGDITTTSGIVTTNPNFENNTTVLTSKRIRIFTRTAWKRLTSCKGARGAKMLIIAAAAMAGGRRAGVCAVLGRHAAGRRENRKAAARLAKAAEKKMGTMDKVLILGGRGADPAYRGGFGGILAHRERADTLTALRVRRLRI